LTGSYLPIALMAMLAAGAAAAFIALSAVLGRVRRSRTDLTPYECGMRPYEPSENKRFSVKFYMIAMLFILFDVEAAFLYPWAVTLRSSDRAFVFGEMAVFLVILVAGYVYVWWRGALDWD
jgi:NADH-quinone oxidoreductase subunit A